MNKNQKESLCDSCTLNHLPCYSDKTTYCTSYEVDEFGDDPDE